MKNKNKTKSQTNTLVSSFSSTPVVAYNKQLQGLPEAITSGSPHPLLLRIASVPTARGALHMAFQQFHWHSMESPRTQKQRNNLLPDAAVKNKAPQIRTADTHNNNHAYLEKAT
jgi:hypothetical protein